MNPRWLLLGVLVLTSAASAQKDAMVRDRAVITVQPSSGASKSTVVREAYYIHRKMHRREVLDSSGAVTKAMIYDCESRTGFVLRREREELDSAHVLGGYRHTRKADYTVSRCGQSRPVHVECADERCTASVRTEPAQ